MIDNKLHLFPTCHISDERIPTNTIVVKLFIHLTNRFRRIGHLQNRYLKINWQLTRLNFPLVESEKFTHHIKIIGLLSLIVYGRPMAFRFQDALFYKAKIWTKFSIRKCARRHFFISFGKIQKKTTLWKKYAIHGEWLLIIDSKIHSKVFNPFLKSDYVLLRTFDIR